MSARKYKNYDVNEFRKALSEKYIEVGERLREERNNHKLRGIDMAEMFSMESPSTYYGVERLGRTIAYENVVKMYSNGFDIEYIFTGNRQCKNSSKDKFTCYSDKEIESLLKSMCVFIEDFKGSYKSLKNLSLEKDDMFYYVKNKDDIRNVYEICREHHGYSQEEMAARVCLSLNKYKEIKNYSGMVGLDSKHLYAFYCEMKIPPLMCVDERSANISEILKLASNIEKDAVTQLKKMNLTLYNLLFDA